MEKKVSGLKRYVSVGLAVGVLLSGLSGFVGNEVSASSKSGSGVSVKDAKPGKPGEKPEKPAKPGVRPVPKKVYKALPIKPMPKIPRGEIVAFGGNITSPGFKEVTGLEKRKLALSLAVTKAKEEQKKRGVTLDTMDDLRKRFEVMRGTYSYKSLQGENMLLDRLDRKIFSLRSEISRIAYPGTFEIQSATTEKQVIELELRLANTVKSVLALDVEIKRQKDELGSHERFLLDVKRGLKKQFEGLKENASSVSLLGSYDEQYGKFDPKVVVDQVIAVMKKRGASATEMKKMELGIRAELSERLVLGNLKLNSRVAYENSFNNDVTTVSARRGLLSYALSDVKKVSQANAKVIDSILVRNGVKNGNLYFDGVIVIF